MGISISFTDLSPESAAHLLVFAEAGYPAFIAGTVVSSEPEEQPQKPRRRRRTKAQMDEVRAQVAEGQEKAWAQEQADKDDTEEVLKRRRRRRSAPDSNVADEDGNFSEEKPKRRRRRRPTEDPEPKRRRRHRAASDNEKPISEGDEITDRDVSKAASEGAQYLTPAAVRGILDQFGVANVGDLDQPQRREFIDMVEQAVEDSDLDNAD